MTLATTFTSVQFSILLKFQVVVKVHVIGVNPCETYIRSGMFRYGSAASSAQFPYIPGSDASGEVDEVGDGVTKFKVRHLDEE